MAKKSLTVKEVALFGMLGALTFGGKFVMSSLPNIEPVSLFVLVFTAVFGLKALFPVGIYVAMEILVYGIQLWNINYLYVWTILALIAYAMRRVQEPLIWEWCPVFSACCSAFYARRCTCSAAGSILPSAGGSAAFPLIFCTVPAILCLLCCFSPPFESCWTGSITGTSYKKRTVFGRSALLFRSGI